MPDHVRKRHFTLEEANGLIPRMRRRMERMMQLSAHLRAGAGGAEGLMPPGIPWMADPVIAAWEAPDPERSRVFAQALYETLHDDMRHIEGLGVHIKDLGIGLLAFPSYLEGGAEVLLSWRIGEKQISFFCPSQGGLRGRRPVTGHAFLSRRVRTGQVRD